MRRTRSLEDRFREKVAVAGPDDCWLWTASTDKDGYGQIGSGPRPATMLKSHRVAYELDVGPIPEGLTIDHLCFNRACCNPAHLTPIPRRANAAQANGRKAECPKGHPYDEANTYVNPNTGRRLCRACHREYQQQRRDARHLS